MAELQMVEFYLSKGLFGVDSSYVKQIIKYQDVTQMPEMPEYYKGTVNIQGDAVPIIDLNKRFGYGITEITKNTKIIIADIGLRQIGFIVDNVEQMSGFDGTQIGELPYIVQNEGNSFVKGVVKKGEQLVLLIELNKVLGDTEIN